MPSFGIPLPDGAQMPTGSGQMAPNPIGAIGAFRLPTDPIYFFTLTLENIVVGSRYRVTRHSTGAELAAGIATSTTEVIAGVPAYSSGMLMDVTVRNASGTPTYKIFDSAAFASPDGAGVYVLQQLDE
jgi:hypothetical protein